MRVRIVGVGSIVRGIHSQALWTAILACFLGVIPIASAEPSVLRPSWDLDGFYVWLGPTGAASHIDAQWDSTFGADAAFVRVRERDSVGVVGATLGASKWTERGGGRVWVDALVGTQVFGHMIGASAGPIVEFAELARPSYGGSIGLWAFLGVTPYARVGEVTGLGAFAEIGVHIALPVLRR